MVDKNTKLKPILSEEKLRLLLISNDVVINYNKNEIITYLRDKVDEAAVAGRALDFITKERIPSEWLIYSDGIYWWDTVLIHHIEKYEVSLPDEFIIHVQKNKEKIKNEDS